MPTASIKHAVSGHLDVRVLIIFDSFGFTREPIQIHSVRFFYIQTALI